MHVLSFSLLVLGSTAREIVFPPTAAYQSPLLAGQNSLEYEIDVSSANFAGLTTFANLPYQHCLAKDENEAGEYDIAILGAPFDTVCTLHMHFTGIYMHCPIDLAFAICSVLKNETASR